MTVRLVEMSKVEPIPGQLHPHIIPIRVPPVEVTIHADRQLTFSILTAFDAVRPNEHGSLRVLVHDGDRWLIEFHTTYTLWFGRRSTIVTTEWVSVLPHSRVEFNLAGPSGYLASLEDRFTLDVADGATRFRYESTFGMRGWIIGWLFGKVVVEPLMRRHMREHAREVKHLIEARSSSHRRAPLPDTETSDPSAPSPPRPSP